MFNEVQFLIDLTGQVEQPSIQKKINKYINLIPNSEQ